MRPRQRTLNQSADELADEQAAESLFWLRDLRHQIARALLDGDLATVADIHKKLGAAVRGIQRERHKREAGEA